MTGVLKRCNPKQMLSARADLLDSAERIVSGAVSDGRAMKPDEQRSFDEYKAQIGKINEALAEYKRQRVADCAGTGLGPVLPF